MKRNIWNFEVDESEVNVYLDQYGYAIYVSGVEGVKKYAAVIGIGDTNAYGSSKNGATLLFPDGTTKEVRYSLKKNTPALTGGNKVDELIGEIVSYTIGDDGVYELTQKGAWTAQNTSVDTKFENGKSAFTLNGQTYYATSETVFFVITGTDGNLDEDDYEVYTGYANMPGFLYDNTDASKQQVGGFAVVADNDYNKQAEYVYIYAKSLEGISDVDTYFVKKKDADIITNSDGSYYVLPAIVDGEATTVKVDATFPAVADNSKAGLFAVKNVVKNSKGIITRFTNVTNSTTFNVAYGTAGTVEANKVVLGIGSNKSTASYYAYDKDTNVYVVDKKYKTIEISSVADVETDSNDKVYAIYDTNNKVLKDVVIVKQDDVALSNKASVGTITLATGVTSTGYSTIAEAITNPVQVADSTARAVSATGEGTFTYKGKVGATASTKDSDLGAFTTASGTYDIGDNLTLIAVTATSEDGSNTVTKYVAVKAETYYTLTVENLDEDTAIMIDGVVVGKAETAGTPTTVTLKDKLVKDAKVSVTYVVEDGGTIGAVTVDGATATIFNKTITFTVGTNNVVIKVANKA